MVSNEDEMSILLPRSQALLGNAGREALLLRLSTDSKQSFSSCVPKQSLGTREWVRLRSAVFVLSVFFASLGLCAPLNAQQSYPMLMGISPVAVQIGTTTECEIESRYSLYGTYKVFVSGDGVVGEVDAPKALKPGEKRPNISKLKVRFKVAADATPGVRDVRLATPLGASTLAQLLVARDPIVRETTSNNDSIKTAQTIPIPCTVCGAIEKREDVDYYKFHVAAGTALTFHVRCHRLQERIHDLQEMADPILTLRNAAGTVIASNDNAFAADPLLHHRFDREGDYY